MRTLNHEIERERDFNDLFNHFGAFVARWGKRLTEARPRCDATAKETLASLQARWEQKPAEAKREKPDLPQEVMERLGEMLGVDPSQLRVTKLDCPCPDCVAERAAEAKPKAAASDATN